MFADFAAAIRAHVGPDLELLRADFSTTGPVERANIPNGVLNSLIQIARASAEELATMSRFDKIDDGALNIVRGIRARAQEVLDHYGVAWQ